jgi:hypothetical protein
MTVVSMSAKEFSRLDVLMDLEARRMTVRDACGLLRLKRRQVFRLLKDFRAHGAASLISKRRGKPGNNRLPQPDRDLVMTLIKERYADFGPTLAAEKLLEVHDCRVSRETVRTWMIEDRLWLDRRRRLPSVHQPRNRRERMGELIQIDGSKHWWFENRGPQCTLLADIDDATSRLLHAAFVPSESTFDYLRETHRYVAAHGRPIAFYSDKHAIFRVSNTAADGGGGLTQFGRALHELTIDIICANTPAAKGRIERSFGTLQDRLVKEMRLAGISTIEAANAFLPGFLAHRAEKWTRFSAPNDAPAKRRSIGLDPKSGIHFWVRCSSRSQPALCPGACQRHRCPPSGAAGYGAGGYLRLEGGAHGDLQPDAPVRQDRLPA